jgi:hypothetical protein
MRKMKDPELANPKRFVAAVRELAGLRKSAPADIRYKQRARELAEAIMGQKMDPSARSITASNRKRRRTSQAVA